MIYAVVLSKSVERSLKKLPPHIVLKLLTWVKAVGLRGLDEVRRVPGYHDEPLKGKLEGVRSIRLNRSYRAYYRVARETVEFVLIERVDKHEY